MKPSEGAKSGSAHDYCYDFSKLNGTAFVLFRLLRASTLSGLLPY